MEKFIVWDKGNQELIENFAFDEFMPINDWFEETDFQFCRAIGKQDILGQEIYADCSIVEFDFLGFGEAECVSYTGFIKWDNERFRYSIEVISHADRHGDNYIFDLGKCIDRIKNIKIIDTIQENKLGLIK